MGLLACSAALVHLTGGLTDVHFHFFVVLGLVAAYQDWRPFLAALGFVVVHHGGLGLFAPELLYSDERAHGQPPLWVAVHAGFVLAASAV